MTTKEFRFRGPLSVNNVMSLNAGDTVYISGPAYEIKTVPQYVRLLDIHKRGERLPFEHLLYYLKGWLRLINGL